MPRKKTFRRRHRKNTQKGGAPSRHWLKVTHKTKTGQENDYSVEIIDANGKNTLCANTSNKYYDKFDDFAIKPETSKMLLLELKNTGNFTDAFDLKDLKTITNDNVNWDKTNC